MAMKIYLRPLYIMMIISILFVGYHESVDVKTLRPLDWWENTVIYEVLVQSFKDSDGDGYGDFKGITSKLTHFFDDDIGTLLLTPFFQSPMEDFGYDISDFYGINPVFGTMADFEELVQSAHKLGIKIVINFIPNHASTQSEYFKRSEAREPGYEDFFMWADPKLDPTNESNFQPPSNWDSRFAGSAWEWSKKRHQYYLHQFLVSQADFNLHSLAVRKELIKIMAFWLDKGVDGFRVDAVSYLFEANPDDYGGLYPDQPSINGLPLDDESSNNYKIFTRDLFENHALLYEWRQFVDTWSKEHKESTRILLSEAYANISSTIMYYGGDGVQPLGSHVPLNFDFITAVTRDSNARDFAYLVQRWLVFMPHEHVANWQLGNHDRPRIASSFGSNMVDGLNSLIMVLPGIAMTYQGEEIGMENVPVSLEQIRDNRVHQMGSVEYSRDVFRTPYQWDNTTSAGFSTNTNTWLSISKDYGTHNLQVQKEAKRSHFKVYKSLSKLRKEPSLSHGCTHIRPLTKYTLLLVRYLESYESYALLFNVGAEDDRVDLTTEMMLQEPMVVCVSSVHSNRSVGDTIPRGMIKLQPREALVMRLPPT